MATTEERAVLDEVRTLQQFEQDYTLAMQAEAVAQQALDKASQDVKLASERLNVQYKKLREIIRNSPM